MKLCVLLVLMVIILPNHILHNVILVQLLKSVKSSK